MNPLIAQALEPFAPPQSVVHQIVSAAERAAVTDIAVQLETAHIREDHIEEYRHGFDSVPDWRDGEDE